MARVCVQPLELTGNTSVATTQVRLPSPKLKATVKPRMSGRGNQDTLARSALAWISEDDDEERFMDEDKLVRFDEMLVKQRLG